MSSRWTKKRVMGLAGVAAGAIAVTPAPASASNETLNSWLSAGEFEGCQWVMGGANIRVVETGELRAWATTSTWSDPSHCERFWVEMVYKRNGQTLSVATWAPGDDYPADTYAHVEIGDGATALYSCHAGKSDFTHRWSTPVARTHPDGTTGPCKPVPSNL